METLATIIVVAEIYLSFAVSVLTKLKKDI